MPVLLDQRPQNDRDQRDPLTLPESGPDVAAEEFLFWAAAAVVALIDLLIARWPSVRRRAAGALHHLLVDAGAAVRDAGSDAFELLRTTGTWLRREWPGWWRRALMRSEAAAVSTARQSRAGARVVWRAAGMCSRTLFRLSCRSAVTRALAAHPRRCEWRASRGSPVVRLLFASAVTASFTSAFVVAAFASAGTVSGQVGSLASWTPEPVELPPLPQRSVVTAADGSVLAVLHAGQNRQPVKLDEISPLLVNAVIDTEDARFWQHGGVDVRAVGRAALNDLSNGGGMQGGSTIAQQLAKNTFLTPQRDLSRKLKELVLADRLEQRYGKRAVLERYLNTVYFGEGAYGVEAAAEAYFGVVAAKVDAAQAALLAGLIQDPDGYSPLRHPVDARQRRSVVLALLVGHGHLPSTAAGPAAAEPLPTTLHQWPDGHDYFTDAVKQELLNDRRLGVTPADRYRMVFAGGLQIHTTVDPRLQAAAQAAVTHGIPTAPMPLSAALAAVDPVDGAVRAVVGGAAFASTQYDAATVAGRQTGSSFKVFTLVAVLEEGYSPNDIIDGSSPCPIPNPRGVPDPWLPTNFEGEAFGPITVTDATVHSVNCAYARLAMMVGPDRIAQVAHQMGVSAPLKAVPSITLGTNGVPPLQMASAYATLAAGGIFHPAHLIQEIDGPDGKPLIKFQDQARRVMTDQVAREATQVMRQVIEFGTGTAAAIPAHPAAGKTGTAENYQDAWFVGFTPQLASAIWMGDPKGEVPMVGVQGINVVGGSFPAQAWSAFMQQALSSSAPLDFSPPDPGQIPGGVMLVPGQPRGASAAVVPGGGTDGPGQRGGDTRATTWCWSSCRH